MQGALYHFAVPRQELVACPVKWGAGVGAGIEVGVNRLVFAHQTYAGALTIQGYFLAGAVGDCIGTTQELFRCGLFGLLLAQVIVGHNVIKECGAVSVILAQDGSTKPADVDPISSDACSSKCGKWPLAYCVRAVWSVQILCGSDDMLREFVAS